MTLRSLLAAGEFVLAPGVFEMSLEPGRTVHLVTAVGKLPEQKPDEIVADQKLFDAGEGRSGIRRQAALCALELLMP